MQRRNFLALFAVPLLMQNLRTSRRKNSDPQATSRYIFSRAVLKSREERWDLLPIGKRMEKIGTLFLGTPYVGGTLEGDGPEVCRLDLTGLDCVTFFESVLTIARLVRRKPLATWTDLIKEVTYTRYRSGVLEDYTSRLHYTADWIEDNIKKGVVADITQEIGGQLFPVLVSYMSEHPALYKPLKLDTSLVPRIASIERGLATTTRYYIPRDQIAKIEHLLHTGDIVAIATSKAGLDYSHTGMIVRDGDQARFMHASLQKKKVVLDSPLNEYIAGVRSHIGVTIVRPIEV